MDNEASILLVVTLAVGGVLMTALLACYACVFRDLCCRRGERSKRRRGSSRSPMQGSGGTCRPRLDTIPLNDITQGESMPTESEKV